MVEYINIKLKLSTNQLIFIVIKYVDQSIEEHISITRFVNGFDCIEELKQLLNIKLNNFINVFNKLA